MAIQPNRLQFLQTLSAELGAQADRIRLLIGDRHWHTDGSHKEAILTSLLCRYLPSGFIAVRGFVISSSDESLCSTEQDILILDTRIEQPLFLAGNVAVAYVEQTVAVISVKTTLSKQMILDAGTGLKSIDSVDQRMFADNRIWKAAFFYKVHEGVENVAGTVLKWISELVQDQSSLGWSLLCLNPSVIVKSETRNPSNEDIARPRYQAYNCPEMATALLLSSLLDVISAFGTQSSVSLPAFLDTYIQDPT